MICKLQHLLSMSHSGATVYFIFSNASHKTISVDAKFRLHPGFNLSASLSKADSTVGSRQLSTTQCFFVGWQRACAAPDPSGTWGMLCSMASHSFCGMHSSYHHPRLSYFPHWLHHGFLVVLLQKSTSSQHSHSRPQFPVQRYVRSGAREELVSLFASSVEEELIVSS